MINARFGVGYTKGVQEGEDPTFLKTVVTLKHWDAYSLEDSDNFTRFNFNAIVSPYAAATTYRPAFRAAILEGKAMGVMCSYNAVNGQPACASQVLTDVLRGKWNFTGYITSDSGALENVYKDHHYVATEQEAACVSLINGTTDVCSGAVYHNAVLGCPKDAITAALRRTFTLRFRLGLFDPPASTPYWSTPLSSIATPAAAALNADATRQSFVLLKHSPGVPGALPWAPGLKIAVLGPHANASTALVGNYLGQICPDNKFDCLDSPYTAIAAANAGGSTVWATGTGLTKNDTAAWPKALAAGAAADAIVLCLGLDGSIEGEMQDRRSIDLPPVQHALAAALAALGKPIVVFLVHAGSVDITAELATPAITAMVDTFYPGVLGARVMAETLFGGNDQLGGKMAYTVYRADYVDAIAMSNMELDGPVGRGYRFFTGDVVLPFGHGLSLTSFALAWSPGVPLPPNTTTLATEAQPSQTLTYSVTVTNVGATAGDEVIQAYYLPVATPAQPASRLRKQLFEYKRLHLAPGQSAEVVFTLDSATLRLSDKASGNLVSTPGQFDLLFTNGVQLAVGASVSVAGAEVVVAEFPY
jgi:beta-D-xylosidase 4